MFYTVECTYTDPESEESWNDFYSLEKLPALISVSGFSTSQRFKALTPGCPVYLAIHTVSDAQVIAGEEYRQKGGGSFARWQAYISDWHRNLYECAEPAPDVAEDELLLLSARPLNMAGTALRWPSREMHAAGLDACPAYRVAYVIPREKTGLFAGTADVYFYEPVTPQLRNPPL